MVAEAQGYYIDFYKKDSQRQAGCLLHKSYWRGIMNYWLMKSEPDVYSIADLKRDRTSIWDGVRNYQARNFLREMSPGDLAFFYHSNTQPPGIVGLMRVVETGIADPTQFDQNSKYYDAKSSKDDPRWQTVVVEFVDEFPNLISLEALKQKFSEDELLVVRKGNRLSVMPISEEVAKKVLILGGQDAHPTKDRAVVEQASSLLILGGQDAHPTGKDQLAVEQASSLPLKLRKSKLKISQRKLPHWELEEAVYFITFNTWEKLELTPEARQVVFNSCKFFDKQRYQLFCLVVMPDHVHILIQPLRKFDDEFWSLSNILHSIKSYSSKEIPKVMKHIGTIWQDERYDRIVRDEREFKEFWEYIRQNPVKAGLSNTPEEYHFLWQISQ